jgi:hypothetical protein
VFIFAGAKFGEIVLKWDAFNYATKFRAMAIYNPEKKIPILHYKWLFWWVFNFRFLCEDVKCAKNEVPNYYFTFK